MTEYVACDEDGCEWAGEDGEYEAHWMGEHLSAGIGVGAEIGIEAEAELGVEVPSRITLPSFPLPEPPSQPLLLGLPLHPPSPISFNHHPTQPPLPERFEAIRPHQWQAVRDVVQAFDEGCDVVWLDAPTGSGKTLIAELVRRIMDERAIYICHGKELQDQFLREFPYSKVLKGRSNYKTQNGPYPYISAEDCTGKECRWCAGPWVCDYQVAKDEARAGEIAVLNTAYFLSEANHVGSLGKGRRLAILDECDVIEDELKGFVEFNLSESMVRDLDVQVPAKGTHKRNIAKWLIEDMTPAVEQKIAETSDQIRQGNSDPKLLKRLKRLARLKDEATRVAGEIEDDNWVRDNKAGPLALKPVEVENYGHENLWRHHEKWLCMSASIISAENMSRRLGVDAAGLKWGVVHVPMTFPVENREVRVVPVANMVYKEKESAYPKIARAIHNILQAHEAERVLVHTVSNDLAKYLHREIGRREAQDRPILTYSNAQERSAAIRDYRENPASVLFAASMDRGVDFKDDDCRVVIVAKVPFPSLGDIQVSEAMHRPGGQEWYSVQTVRKLVQMTGRGVRHENDWCVTYILDGMFGKKIWRGNRGLLPKWWQESVVSNYDGRWIKG